MNHPTTSKLRSFSWVVISLCLVATARAQAVPGPMRGEMLASASTPAGALKNLTLLSLSSSSVYDDNLSNSAVHHHSGEQQYLTATFGVQQTRKHLRWTLSYRPGVAVGAQNFLGNQFSQVFGGSFELQPSVRWSLKLRQDYAVTIDPFEHLGEAPLQTSLGPLERPNELTALPQLRRTASFSGAGLSYRLSRHTTLGVAGSYAVQRYRDYTSDWARPLVNNSAATGQTYLSRQFSRRYTAGLEYRALTLTFPGYDMRALTHSILSFHQFDLSVNSSVVLYAGPEYSRTHGQMFIVQNAPATSASWSPAAGAVLTWTTVHTRLQAGYSRRVSDGGGLQGPVRLNAGWMRLGWQLGRRWIADLGAELAQQAALPVASGNRLRMLRTGAGFRRALGRNASLRFAYDRLYQTDGSLAYRPGNHNRVLLSFEHSFMWPLGR